MINSKQIVLTISLLFFCIISKGQTSEVFGNIKFDESHSKTKIKVKKIAKSTRVIKVSSPSFPLAKYKEEHLIATNVKLNNEIIDKVVFIFSDDKLSYIQAKGTNSKSLNLSAKAKSYLHYTVYESDLIFVDEEKDLTWFLTPESVHPNLFTWNNPYLFDSKLAEVIYNPSVKVPSFIKLGKNIEQLSPLLKKNCDFIDIQTLTDNKSQINCYGIEYAGFPRKFEARFDNGILNMVWILTGKGEEDRIRKKLVSQYGEAVFINKDWEVFNNWTVLLRKDKPEILLLTKKLGQSYKKQYTN